VALSIVRPFLDLVIHAFSDVSLFYSISLSCGSTDPIDSIFVTWCLWLATAATITIGLTDKLSCNPQDPENIFYCTQLKAIVSLAWFIWFAAFLSSICFVCFTLLLYRALITVTFIIALIHRLPKERRDSPGDTGNTGNAGMDGVP